MRTAAPESLLRRLLRRLATALAAAAATLCFFLVLPLIQTLAPPREPDLVLREVDTGTIPPPPPPPPEQREPEDEPEPEPPSLGEESPPLELAQLEIALDAGFGGDWSGGAFPVALGSITADGGDFEALFALSDLDQKPRAISQPSPMVDANMRRKRAGTVVVTFTVGVDGRVEDMRVQSSTADPVFDRAALAAVKRWKYEPGLRNGQPVPFRIRQPITFPQD